MANKLFGTDGVRGTANVYPMTAEFAFNLACVLSKLICKRKNVLPSARYPNFRRYA